MVIGDDVAIAIEYESGADGSIDWLENLSKLLRIDSIGAKGIVGFDFGIGRGDRDDGRRDLARHFFKMLFEIGNAEVVGDFDAGGGIARAVGGGRRAAA